MTKHDATSHDRPVSHLSTSFCLYGATTGNCLHKTTKNKTPAKKKHVYITSAVCYAWIHGLKYSYAFIHGTNLLLGCVCGWRSVSSFVYYTHVCTLHIN